jgi:hypothetical protein
MHTASMNKELRGMNPSRATRDPAVKQTRDHSQNQRNEITSGNQNPGRGLGAGRVLKAQKLNRLGQ